MRDLINRQTLLDVFDSLRDKKAENPVIIRLELAIKLIEVAPTVEAEPIQRATLKATGFDEIYCEWGDCTNCGTDNMMLSKFCRGCGASLRRDG